MRSVGISLAYAALLLVGILVYEGRLDIHLPGRAAASGLCGKPQRSFGYGWPVRPFDEQHPVRGGFGDPRTMTSGAFGVADKDQPGDYSFHNGIDIAAAPGTKVYPVVSGWATPMDGDAVRVQVGQRVFQYHHIKPFIHDRRRVIADVTVLGTVKRPLDHVHLTEIDDGHVVDPLLHIRPYSDHTKPEVQWVTFRTVDGHKVSPGELIGRVVVSAEADDEQAIPVPGAWKGFPITPSLVDATLVNRRGAEVWQRTVADFRYTEPPNSHFWQVYASGTYQNFPVFGHHYYFQRPGQYIFRLTRHPLDTRHLADGTYTLEVSAQDLCGNHTTFDQPVRVVNRVLRAA